MKSLSRQIRFSGMHASSIGAIVSALNYYGTDVSPAWVFGMTGHAFLTVVDERLSDPNVGLPEETMFKLSGHLGANVEGFDAIAAGGTFETMQREAWEKARTAIDKGYPVFAKELDLGNETSLVYGYTDNGYRTFSWHSGNGHEGADDDIPWTMLGRNYCPCRMCRGRPPGPSTDIYLGGPKDGGLISLHWVTLKGEADGWTALREAVRFAAAFGKTGPYRYGHGTFYAGPRAYDRWIEAVRDGTITCLHMGYFAGIWHESRHYAVDFLREAQDRFVPLAGLLGEMAIVYESIRDDYRRLVEAFPWRQPEDPIGAHPERQQAIDLLTRIRDSELEASRLLDRLSKELEGRG
ncbi:flagellar protein FliT [Paenibacillus flagellatus]|uniref:Uncharacterized protein n=1 Tax=Paenibacillus flagellatus TaxID=2211139 RepID=A0A2V5KNF6_9BACL|nr:flagellar protein FliT [Paenibacillus flagellatus]PYI52607.1 hypothetical protein DLM86_20775 [Paenibacillus flagellatus]